MKKITYVGSVQKDIGHFPVKAAQRIVAALTILSVGAPLNPKDFKYMPTIGLGCYELRVKLNRQYRVLYVTKFQESIYVLHAFVKKTEKTSKQDIEIGGKRYKALLSYRQERKYD